MFRASGEEMGEVGILEKEENVVEREGNGREEREKQR